MPDIIIYRNYNRTSTLYGRASVRDKTKAGLACLAAHIDPKLAAEGLITVPNDLAEEFRDQLIELDDDIDIEVV